MADVKSPAISLDSSGLTSDDHPRKKLKMRKGTKSCSECRRRKKSCIPHPSSSTVCTECFARGVQCQEQQPLATAKRPSPDSKQSLQQRVAELETALQSIGSKLNTISSSSETETDAAKTLTQLRADLVPSTPAASSVAEASPDQLLENAPVLSLFNNSILSRHQEDTDDDTAGSHTPPRGEQDASHSSKVETIRWKLLSLFPSQATIDAILDASQAWWHITQAIFPEIYGPERRGDVKQFVEVSKASKSVQKIAKALLCVSISVQEAPPGSILELGPSVRPTDVVAHWLNAIHELVISDDEIAGTIDGIECLYLHAKHDINDGRLRRSWITLRRGLSFSQLLGLHTSTPSSRLSSKSSSLRGKSLYNALYQGDRFLSLLLGLPCAVSEVSCPMPDWNGDSTLGDFQNGSDQYLLKLAGIIGHIIDRNQEPHSNNTLHSTVKIETELADLAACMPSEWWANDNGGKDIGTELYSRLLPAFWYHQARTLLHLPYMLKAATDRRYGYNKIATLESAREMVQRYQVFRPTQGFGSLCCKVVDFQVFTAAMILVLNLLSTSQSSSAREQEEAAMDDQLITATHDLLHRASLETEGGVAIQAAKALKMFCKTRADPCPPDKKSAKIVIPYFGTVVFAPGKSFANQSYMSNKGCGQQPVQLPTPEMESLDTSPYDATSFDNFSATMPGDLNFGGYQTQPQEGGLDGGVFANVNLDLDQDWSWFWDNTNIA